MINTPQMARTFVKMPVTPVLCSSLSFKPSEQALKTFTASLSTQSDKKCEKVKMECLDGNEAAASVAYQLSDSLFVFPITPSTPMAEYSDAWIAEGRKNIDGQVVQLTQMQSEAGVAGCLHGAVVAGSRVSTFTCSQGLLLMIPTMYRISGERKPCVLHIASRVIYSGCGSMFADHGDVMAVRNTGWAIMSSHSVQESQDLALITHIASLRSSIPFVHFFDGIRTSHEINKIVTLPQQVIKKMAYETEAKDCLNAHRANALHPWKPSARGAATGVDVYMQGAESNNLWQQKIPAIVEDAMGQLAKLTGRSYHLFDYVGAPDAENIMVMMGSGSQTVEEVVNYLNAQSTSGPKYGLIKVRLFRPFSMKHFVAALPKSAKRVCVLERCKDGLAAQEPLCEDICAAWTQARQQGLVPRSRELLILGGRHGLGLKEFTPTMAKTVFDNLMSKTPKDRFSIGIEDDVTHMSLPYHTAPLHVLPKGTVECIFWGMGSDGTVGANKEAISIVGDNTPLHVQGYFWYDAFKSGAATVSHLRFGPHPIKAPYLVQSADYIACHHNAWVHKYDLLKGLKQGGVFVLNTQMTTIEQLESSLPASLKRGLAKHNAKFYAIDARKIAENVGLGKRINMIMQVCFFALSKVMPLEEAISLLKDAIKKAYGKKGTEIVQQNLNAVDHALSGLQQIQYNQTQWAEAVDSEDYKTAQAKTVPPKEMASLLLPVMQLNGDSLPVSSFMEAGCGQMSVGHSQYLKRTTALQTPTWLVDKCTQCNNCAMVCPHAAIRPFVLTSAQEDADREASRLPKTFRSKPLANAPEKLSALSLKFSINVSPTDCTGCGLCVAFCPDKALEMHPIQQQLTPQGEEWEYARALPTSFTSSFDKYTVRGSQFQQPLLEFSAACDGCGETPYVKLLTQLFGTRLVIGNATGCSQIWGGYYGCVPYTTNSEGKGPAWGTSLFENNAEYGFGLYRAYQQRQLQLHSLICRLLASKAAFLQQPSFASLIAAMKQWKATFDTRLKEYVSFRHGRVAKALGSLSPATPSTTATATEEDSSISTLHNAEAMNKHAEAIVTDLKGVLNGSKPTLSSAADKEAWAWLQEMNEVKNGLNCLSVWSIGGDGWAYDIGYAGLDHVIASGERMRILVLDNEFYSNTGGQRSKATSLGAMAKLISTGNVNMKKDLGKMAMSYGDVYVASVAIGANMGQCLKAFVEAESFPGAALILAYVPCAMHGNEHYLTANRDKIAVDSGYWTLYRYDPRLKAKGENPFQLDSKKIKADLIQTFLKKDQRFQQMTRYAPALSQTLQTHLKQALKEKRSEWKEIAEHEVNAEAAAEESKL
eukprot:TRINITY_DN11682_c0_g1_i1.p1 TRINITY_DN11682_c0_g1~~TRINITY_DN11682_c0_g1_i1.p1  ORF type:complete len:1378 (+),score=420.50 TRINITY_DN11682_c0_g1_i1:155-4135(+)